MQTLFWLTCEDGPIESIGHLALAAACILFCLSAIRVRAGSTLPRPSRTRGLIIGLAICMFVLFGEEVSWGQRHFGFETPATWAELNYQGETNLHNTSFLQFYLDGAAIYIYMSFVFLSLAPLLVARWPAAHRWAHRWGVLVAPKPIALGFALLATAFWWRGLVPYVTYDVLLSNSFEELLETISEVLWFAYAIYCYRHIAREAVASRPPRKAWAVAAVVLMVVAVLQVEVFRSRIQFPSREDLARAYFFVAETVPREDTAQWLDLSVASLEKAVLYGCREKALPRMFVLQQLELVKAEVERGQEHLALARLHRVSFFQGYDQLTPYLTEALLAEASLLLEQDAYEQAVDRASRCLESDPTRREAYRIRGIALASLGKGREAEPDLIGSLGDSPEQNADLLLFLSAALIVEGEIDLAEGHLNDLLRQMPNLAEARSLLSDCKRLRNQGTHAPVRIGK